MKNIGIEAIEYYFPEKFLDNDSFKKLNVNPVFMAEKIGIEKRFIAAENESVGDMAVQAISKLLAETQVVKDTVKLLILCTQNPDYSLPTTACIVQDRVGFSTDTISFDINLGCSGFVYSCAVAKSMMEMLDLEYAIVVTSEAYSKVISYDDRTTATIFSDAAAATLLKANSKKSRFGNFNFGTDGSGFDKLIVPVSGSRKSRDLTTSKEVEYSEGVKRSDEQLFMDGQEITKFVFREVPKSINQLLSISNYKITDIDRFIFHQANKYMLESLGRRMELPEEKVYIDLSRGNTVSSTLPIALKNLYSQELNNSENVVLSGFGVGYSWANAILEVFESL